MGSAGSGTGLRELRIRVKHQTLRPTRIVQVTAMNAHPKEFRPTGAKLVAAAESTRARHETERSDTQKSAPCETTPYLYTFSSPRFNSPQ